MKAYSVSQLACQISEMIEKNNILSQIAVQGEVSNFKHSSSGHLYFSLKDENAKINCVMFRKDVMNIDFIPKDGMFITVWGKVSFYEKTGTCQIYAAVLIDSGQGVLLAKFIRLKEELQKAGYFSQQRKKPIPYFPKKVAVATSPSGSVIYDIVKILRRRNPTVEIILCPCAVSGKNAENEISDVINYICERNLADVIILARGGGSIEELRPFNERKVAQAIYDSHIPVISAIGHETDYTISDFTSDLRAATPSAAAQIVTVSISELKKNIADKQKYLYDYANRMISEYRSKLASIKAGSPLNKMPYNVVSGYKKSLASHNTRLYSLVQNMLQINKIKLHGLKARIEGSDVKNNLKKGYAIAYKNDIIIKSIEDISINENIEIKFSKFSVSAKVTGIKGESYGKQKKV